ncbi:MAG: DUF359 domain-containing protein [Thermosphaera sp.]
MGEPSHPIPCLKPPGFLRKTLSLPQGKLYVSEKPVISGLSSDATIGDVVSSNHISRVKIVDYKTKRFEKVRGNRSERTPVIRLVNPAGCVSLNSFVINLLKTPFTAEVVGEEDLLVFSLAPSLVKSGRVLYGQPNTGVVELEADGVRILKLLKTFKLVKTVI